MPRSARRMSESGFYHVMLRGNGRQVIFGGDADRREFVHGLRDVLPPLGVGLMAWCLMSNHVHLLLSDADGHLSEAVHALATRYAGYFNRVTGHVGSVFDGRFRSVPIESDAQLLAAVRYIHENPVKAGVCASPDYPWSSYREYVGEPSISDVGPVLDLVGGVEQFERFSSDRRPSGYCFRAGVRVPEDEAADVARAAVYPLEPSELKALDISERNRLLVAMRETGLSVRQIERLTGIGRYAVEKGLLVADVL